MEVLTPKHRPTVFLHHILHLNQLLIRFTVHPEEIWTLTTLTIGTKGKPKIPSPLKSSFPLPFTQIFDDEQIPSPPKFWYDQMGAFEIAAEAHGSNNQV